MKTHTLLLVSALSLLASTALAGTPFDLTFEGSGNLNQVLDFYNGGTNSAGASGTNYGIGFSSNALSIVAASAGGTGNIGGLPTPNTALFFLSGSADTMNVAAGFDTGFSFYYSAPYYTGFVNVWSGLNSTGTLLASLQLGLTPAGPAGHNYDPFVPVGVAFSGVAQSVDFGGSADYIAFDNITLNSDKPLTGTPGPAAVVPFVVGLAAAARRRRSC